MPYIPPVIPAPVKRLNLRDVSLRRVLVCIASLLSVSLSLARAVQSVSLQSVSLAWDASPGPNVAGYRVYYGTSSGSLSQNLDAGPVTIATVPNLSNATTYFFAVTAYNTAGESQRSNVVSYTTPATPVELYSLTVNNGTGSGEYPEAAEVRVSANPAPQGQQFEVWDGDWPILDDRTSKTPLAFMIARDLTIYPVYSAVPTYGVTVTNGTGDGNYPVGAPVTVVADAAPTGQQFAGWTGNVTFTSPSSPTTTFTMPSSAVAITATYSAVVTTGGTGLRGQYYNDGSGVAYPLSNPYTGLPVLTRTDATVDFYWDSSGSPTSQVNKDNFSVKWTGQVKAPVSGSYTFTVTGDDGVRLFLNGTKVIDEWRQQDSTAYTYTTTLTAQTLYNIELHFYEQTEAAECRLHWSYLGQADQAIPQSQLYPPAGL